MPEYKAHRELAFVKRILTKEYLEHRLKAEFGLPLESCFYPYEHDQSVRQEWKPLGTLLHIAAGNVNALPAFSVFEGLLTKNINILKLLGSEGGLSIVLLQELIKIEHKIAPYVFVFDYPSTDIDAMENFAACADAIVVWGGDAAVSAVWKIAQPNTKIIEWGHKISFAYVSGNDISDRELYGVAYNIYDTDQTLCSSCQGIFLDTDSFDEVIDFAQHFLKILDNQAASMPARPDPFLDAQKTLELYTEELESLETEKKVFRAEHCSVIAYKDPSLHPSYMFRNCWVKPLPEKDLLTELLPYQNHLQTVALISDSHKRSTLESIFTKTGVVRITSGKKMSMSYYGQLHDGEFPLRRYMKLVSYEY